MIITTIEMSSFQPFSINLRGKLIEYDRPAIMGIINVTPDSFYAGSRTESAGAIRRRAELIMRQGADMIDIGAYSSRPGADDICPEEETERLCRGVEAVRSVAPEVPISVDTFRAAVAETAITEFGADIINDIAGGDLDSQMFATVARLRVPYILMHLKGTPATMQHRTDYNDVTLDVTASLSAKLAKLEELGVADVIVDPGLGFGKTVEHNYRLLHDLPHMLEALRRPLLIGLSRKSMLYKPLHITPEEALNATTAANMMALVGGASILRVHDVEAARQALTVYLLTTDPTSTSQFL